MLPFLALFGACSALPEVIYDDELDAATQAGATFADCAQWRCTGGPCELVARSASGEDLCAQCDRNCDDAARCCVRRRDNGSLYCSDKEQKCEIQLTRRAEGQ